MKFEKVLTLWISTINGNWKYSRNLKLKHLKQEQNLMNFLTKNSLLTLYVYYSSDSQPFRHSVPLKRFFKLSVPPRMATQPPSPPKKTYKSFFSHKIFAIQCFIQLKIFTSVVYFDQEMGSKQPLCWLKYTILMLFDVFHLFASFRPIC